MSENKKTRRVHEVWLLGSVSPEIVGETKNDETGDLELIYSFYQRKLPSKRQVLQQLFYLKSEEMKGKSLNHVVEKVVKEIESIWDQAKIPAKQTKNSCKRLSGLFSDWRDLQKDKAKCHPKAVQKRTDFLDSLDQLFDISAEGAEELILLDKTRTEEAKREDIMFLTDQRGQR